MRRFTLRSLWSRRRRAALTALAVALGTAMVTGTIVFTDTIHRSFDRLFAGGVRGAALVVSGRQRIAADPASAGALPGGLVGRLGRLTGVAAAAGQVVDTATVVGSGGRTITGGRLPTAALSYLPAPFRGVQLLSGAPPVASNQVVLDEATARRGGYRLGDRVPILTAQPVRPFVLVGTATLGGDAGGGQPFAAFSLRAAQALYGRSGTVDRIDLALTPGATPAGVAKEVRPLLPAGALVRTAAAQADVQTRSAQARVRTLSRGLVAFTIVAAVIGALLVFNTFSIAATQRAAELSLLRALGATRMQVLGGALLEALVVGVVGALAGVIAGPLVALGVRAVLDAAGAGLPPGGVAVRPHVLIGLGVGVGAALLAALPPALRSARARPLEALRAALAPPRARRRARAALSAVLVAAGVAVVLAAHGAQAQRLRAAGIGGGLVVVGVLLAAPLLVEVAARGLGTPVQRRRAIIARLAREQVLRAPTRTAVSASSLTIGLALVLLVTAYATALRAAARDAVAASFRGDLAIEARDGVSPIPAASVQAAASAPGLLGLSSLRTAQATLARAGTVTVDAVEPSTWGSVYRFDWLDGSASALAALGPGDALVEEDIAQVAHLRVGDHMVLIGGQGQRVRANVRGVYRDPGLLRGVVLDAAWFAQEFHQPRLRAVFVRVGAGAGGATAAVREALRAFPGVVVRSPGALAGEAGRDAANVVGLLYALLGLSLLMALSGIAGTLTLSVHERTRELGLLRALGMTRSQARALVRDEALISAGVGSVSGLALGLALGWTVVHAEAPEGLTFTLPWPWLIGAAAVGIAAGVLGAVGPGRRAARLDVLAAIAHE